MAEQLNGNGNGNGNGPVFGRPGPSESSLTTIPEMSSEAAERPLTPTSNESKGTGHQNGNGSLEVAQPQSTQPEDILYQPVPRARSRSLPPFFLRDHARAQASPIPRPGHIMIYTSGGFIEMPEPPESSSTSPSRDNTNGGRSTAAEPASPITGGPVRRPTPENLRAVGGFFSSNDIAFAEATVASGAQRSNNTSAPPPSSSGHGQRGDNAPGGEVHRQSHSALEPSPPRGQIEDEAPRQRRWYDRIRQRFRRSRNQDENRDANRGENRSNFRRIVTRIFSRDTRNRS